eukprot:CAMPEP_0194292430 /NCGR_PEP_ID=MMETSP0169-20130528/45591_1 /TAXON_ID=218684 /ORGANISM="Corethron pennatum, Strain L29A3" /LENGTH=477 /DNA_ID=CAMNT_0039040603 /DNA_START=191 /DNA_END=1624 /DNA_ORIENTATION=-
MLVTVLMSFLSLLLRSRVLVPGGGLSEPYGVLSVPDSVLSAPAGVFSAPPAVHSSKFCASNGTNTPLIIHAGPHKTATSTLQTMFEVNRHLMLKKTGLTYMGKFTKFNHKVCPEDVPFCLDQDFVNKPTADIVVEFETTMRAKLGGGGVVLSGEGFSKLVSARNTHILPGYKKDLTLKSLQGMQGCFDMTILLAYRRYFEWILSAYNSLQKIRKGRNSYEWPKKGGRYYGSGEGPDVIGDGGKGDDALEYDGTFKIWFESLHDREKCQSCNYSWAKFWGAEHHPTEWTARYFARSFPGIRTKVYNLHQEGDIFSNFVCQTMPGTKDFCDALRRGEGEQAPSMNPTDPFEHDRLAVVAHAAGLITTELPAPERRFVRKKFLEAFPDVPSRPGMKYVCPREKDLEKLFATSIKYEKRVYQKYFSLPKGEKETSMLFKRLELEQRNSFDEYKRQKKFCNWDVDYIIEHDLEIRNWFKELK